MIGQRARLGMALFLLNDGVLFFMLVGAFVYFRGSTVATAARYLSLQRAIVYTACLAASSWTMWRATRGHARLWLGGTIVLGAAFLYGQGGEYWRLFRNNITISRNQFGTTFFTLTGIHALHVLVGIVVLAVLLALSGGEAGGEPGPRASMSATALYWYFVSAVWLVIFAVVYLWTFL